MRISPVLLLVLIAIVIPFVVQIRTVAGFVGIEVTIAQNIAIGAFIIAAIVVWAIWPDKWVPGRRSYNGG